MHTCSSWAGGTRSQGARSASWVARSPAEQTAVAWPAMSQQEGEEEHSFPSHASRRSLGAYGRRMRDLQERKRPGGATKLNGESEIGQRWALAQSPASHPREYLTASHGERPLGCRCRVGQKDGRENFHGGLEMQARSSSLAHWTRELPLGCENGLTPVQFPWASLHTGTINAGLSGMFLALGAWRHALTTKDRAGPATAPCSGVPGQQPLYGRVL